MRRLHVEVLGAGGRVVLVHGSVTNAALTWARQRPLSERFRLELVTRPGFPPNPPVERVDFELDAPLVAEQLARGTPAARPVAREQPRRDSRPLHRGSADWRPYGAHLVGHSYGGVVALLAAALRPDAVRSLTVVEPPCFGVARGHPAVDAFVDEYEREVVPLRDPRERLERFLGSVGSRVALPEPLTPELEQGARMQMLERGPEQAVIPFAALREGGFPVLVASGAHHPAFDAVCDVLERELGAERAVFPGGGHGAQRVGEPFNARLADFLERAEGGTPASGR